MHSENARALEPRRATDREADDASAGSVAADQGLFVVGMFNVAVGFLYLFFGSCGCISVAATPLKQEFADYRTALTAYRAHLLTEDSKAGSSEARDTMVGIRIISSTENEADDAVAYEAKPETTPVADEAEPAEGAAEPGEDVPRPEAEVAAALVASTEEGAAENAAPDAAQDGPTPQSTTDDAKKAKKKKGKIFFS